MILCPLSDDGKFRYNTTSILARVAKQYPEDVEPAIPSFIDALDADFEYSRSNACWAWGISTRTQHWTLSKSDSFDSRTRVCSANFTEGA